MLAFSLLYLLPTLLPERTTPPGNGRMTPGTLRIAATAASAAASAAACVSPRIRKLPPPTPFTVPNDVLAEELAVHGRHAPVALPSSSLLICQPSPKKRRLPPTLIVLPGVAGSPL